MNKRIIASFLVLSLIMLAFTGCKKDNPADGDFASEVSETATSSIKTDSINPLTGLNTLNPSAKNNRPVALMINNIDIAQTVQTGLDYADIVYETEVEGGITRLMAVFKDVSVAQRLGTIRSARYSYVELAEGHDAIYCHAGFDPNYCAPLMKELGTDNFNLDSGASSNYGFRESNGLASEHTLYTTGDNLVNGFKDLGWRTDVKSEYSNPWQKFAEQGTSVSLTGGTATSVSVPFSDSYTTGFNYDSATKMYLKTQDGDPHMDSVTNQQISTKNVIVLFSTITSFPDGYHRHTDLTSGTGYYISEGNKVDIKWSKGSSVDQLKFTDTTGNPLTMNAGRSWICLVDSSRNVEIA